MRGDALSRLDPPAHLREQVYGALAMLFEDSIHGWPDPRAPVGLFRPRPFAEAAMPGVLGALRTAGYEAVTPPVFDLACFSYELLQGQSPREDAGGFKWRAWQAGLGWREEF